MSSVSLIESDNGVQVHVPMTFKTRSGRRQIVVPDGLENAEDSTLDYHQAMVIAISRAHRWKKMLDKGRYGSIAELAPAVRVNRHYLARMLRLTLLAPDIIEAILDGREPDGMSLEVLRKPMSMMWGEQIACLMSAAGNAQVTEEGSTIRIVVRGSQAKGRDWMTARSSVEP